MRKPCTSAVFHGLLTVYKQSVCVPRGVLYTSECVWLCFISVVCLPCTRKLPLMMMHNTTMERTSASCSCSGRLDGSSMHNIPLSRRVAAPVGHRLATTHTYTHCSTYRVCLNERYSLQRAKLDDLTHHSSQCHCGSYRLLGHQKGVTCTTCNAEQHLRTNPRKQPTLRQKRVRWSTTSSCCCSFNWYVIA